MAEVQVGMMRHPPRRPFPERPDDAGTRRPRDVDSTARLYRFRAGVYAIPGGVVLSMGLGWKLGPVAGLIGLILGWVIAYFLIVGLMEGAARAAQRQERDSNGGRLAHEHRRLRSRLP